jgi:hypothetical protein
MKTLLLFFSLILILSYTISAHSSYLTKSGSKYNTSYCSYHSKSKISIELSEDNTKMKPGIKEISKTVVGIVSSIRNKTQ